MSDLQTLIEGATDEQIALLEQLDDRVLNGHGGTVEAFRRELAAVLEHRAAIAAGFPNRFAARLAAAEGR